MPPLKRNMYGPDHALGPTVGKDVQIAKFGVGRYESEILPKPPGGYTYTYGDALQDAVEVIQKREGIKPTGDIGQPTWDVIWPHIDAYRKWQYRQFEVPDPPPPPMPTIVNPLPKNAGGYICQGLHATAGLDFNWAIDFCADPGTPILAVSDARILYVSGHDPNDDSWDAMGVYGWSVHYLDDQGYRYYLTHLGDPRPNFMGSQRIEAGEKLGRVGNQKFRPDHLHLGVTSPQGTSDARERITAVSVAPRVTPL